MEQNKIYLLKNENNEIIVLTNQSNHDPSRNDYEIINGDYEEYFPITDSNRNYKYKFINNKIIEKTSEEKSLELQKIQDEKNDIMIKEKLLKNDLSIIRALLENDTIKIEAHKLKQTELRNQLKKKG